ncbi:unnamed protein product [Protopolystoma xenopodis]|uniref:Uncharacterized protein n=1 Tax=Protopolystoma xenopodis TaxID=117903 RepID=A0A448WVM7_9PLAT|nr:unnamed protein product [Protopolystoma xenopodis]
MPSTRLGMYHIHGPTLEMMMHKMDSGQAIPVLPDPISPARGTTACTTSLGRPLRELGNPTIRYSGVTTTELACLITNSAG